MCTYTSKLLSSVDASQTEMTSALTFSCLNMYYVDTHYDRPYSMTACVGVRPTMLSSC